MIALRGVRCTGAFLISFSKLSTTSSLSAGHSHWQNVRHIKAAKDKIKSSNSQYYTSLLRRAMKEKQPDQKIKEIIAGARAAKVPQSTLDRALNDTEVVDPYVISARATGGILILAETTSPKALHESQRMASICKKYGFKASLPETDTVVRDFFDHSGFVICEPNEKMTNLDEAVEIGLEVGAEEVESVKLSDSETVFQFQCPPHEVSQLVESLREVGANVIESEDRYTPKELIQITNGSYKNMEEMYRKLRDHCEAFERFFDNVEVTN